MLSGYAVSLKIDVAGFGPHALRATAATNALDHDIDMQLAAKDVAWMKEQGAWQPGADTLQVLDRAKEARFDDAHPHLVSFVMGYYDTADEGVCSTPVEQEEAQ